MPETDVGVRVAGFVYDLLQIDAEWTEWHSRGFKLVAGRVRPAGGRRGVPGGGRRHPARRGTGEDDSSHDGRAGHDAISTAGPGR